MFILSWCASSAPRAVMYRYSLLLRVYMLSLPLHHHAHPRLPTPNFPSQRAAHTDQSVRVALSPFCHTRSQPPTPRDIAPDIAPTPPSSPCHSDPSATRRLVLNPTGVPRRRQLRLLSSPAEQCFVALALLSNVCAVRCSGSLQHRTDEFVG